MQAIKRFGLLAVAAIALIAAFVVFKPDSNDKPDPRPSAKAPTTTAPTAAAGPATTPAAAPRPDPGPLLRKGKLTTIKVTRGDTVRLRAVSGAAEELHVHGYDIMRELKPGQTTRLAFKANAEGIFEIELERSGIQVAELRVNP